MVQDFVRNTIKQFDFLIISFLKDNVIDTAMVVIEYDGEKEREWNWDRWRQYLWKLCLVLVEQENGENAIR
ncbi:uncharacterized protein DS421_9g280990 [Arachis hypogaea]|nr:uncharacterized protein DS421_9g280990 [Arachis hypogaea]